VLAGKPWKYSVVVSDSGKRPLPGTVETELVVTGLGVVGRETPAVHHLNHGLLRDNLTFPAAAVGHPITLVTVVHTPSGSVALGWPVTVQK
jgi:hypothetical protein